MRCATNEACSNTSSTPTTAGSGPSPRTACSSFRNWKRFARDRGVREIQDLPRRAVVRLQLVDRRVGKAEREGEDVLERRAAERVDRLRVVADDHHVPAHRGHRVDDVGLQLVRVLVLVDEDVAEAALERGGDLRVVVEQHFPEHEQVVEVHRVRVALALLVAAEDVHDLVAVDREVRVVLLEVQLERRAGVDQERVDVEEDVALREALLQRLDAEGGDRRTPSSPSRPRRRGS